MFVSKTFKVPSSVVVKSMLATSLRAISNSLFKPIIHSVSNVSTKVADQPPNVFL